MFKIVLSRHFVQPKLWHWFSSFVCSDYVPNRFILMKTIMDHKLEDNETWKITSFADCWKLKLSFFCDRKFYAFFIFLLLITPLPAWKSDGSELTNNPTIETKLHLEITFMWACNEFTADHDAIFPNVEESESLIK